MCWGHPFPCVFLERRPGFPGAPFLAPPGSGHQRRGGAAGGAGLAQARGGR